MDRYTCIVWEDKKYIKLYTLPCYPRKLPEEELILLLQECHLDWNQQEEFADILMGLSQEKQFDFLGKALAIYQYIQKESKVFSFGINTKIASAKNK